MIPDESTKKKERHYTPSFRLLIDLLLGINVVFFMVYAGKLLPGSVALTLGVVFNAAFLFFWFVILRSRLTISIVKSKISGPSVFFNRQEILLRRVDLRRTLEYHRKDMMLGYRDLWSIDGEKIRLYRRVLGKEQMKSLMKVVKEYPFRERPNIKDEE